ncbi:MAG: pyruvate kinase [Anaerolineaceae bacterium]|nr:pyruvate kinase [Anaerolineaceae bacterium]
MKTEIYGTLGPACADPGILAEMLMLGMNGVRLNLSHMSLEEAEPMLDSLRRAMAESGKNCSLLIDMQGPELRIGSLKAPLTLTEGTRISLDALCIPDRIREEILSGQEILLDDGKMLLAAEASGTAVVIRGGILLSRKSITLPGTEISLPPLTEQDLQNIGCAAAFGVTGVMQPFVRFAEDLEAVRAAVNAAGGEHIRLFAKIEDMNGVACLPDLMRASDEIVIARGDLGNAMPLWKLPAVQKQISAQCRAAGRPFMVVTQMLSSMEQNPVPTRAEISDIFNAVLDGAASVMVTGETAAGKYPREVIRYLAKTAAEAERYRDAFRSDGTV